MAGYDYVLEQAKESYYDPNHTEHLSQQLTFDEFLQGSVISIVNRLVYNLVCVNAYFNGKVVGEQIEHIK